MDKLEKSVLEVIRNQGLQKNLKECNVQHKYGKQKYLVSAGHLEYAVDLKSRRAIVVRDHRVPRYC